MIIIIRRLKYQVSADDTLSSIANEASAEARSRLKKELADEIDRSPNVSTVEYMANGEKIYKRKENKTPLGNDPYDLYSHTSDDGRSFSASRTTPKRENYVREINLDGTEKISKEEDFIKKINTQKVTDDEKAELSRLVRVSSPDAVLYKNSEKRSETAYNDFDKNKYLIEQVAAKVGVPASLLGSMYFKQIADKATLSGAVKSKYAKASYDRLYGVPFSANDEALAEYLNTPEGVLDFMAIGIKGEADYLGLDINQLSKNQLNHVLTMFGRRNNTDPAYASSVMAYNSVFDNIYKKIPSQNNNITLG